uniref:Myelin regulatory factor n=1 Tax=Stomoxys calcitrans TaxID=35570 RepID=A0A1I8Q621_STOCA
MDYHKTCNDRADYVGGIDNEAIFFEDLQVTAGIGRLGSNGNAEGRHNTNNNSSSNNVVNSPALLCSAKTETPVTSPTSLNNIGADIILPPIPTVSARVSLTATPHIGINNAGNNGRSSTHTHLPESPPDSGSEPPYSPLQDVQGLTLAPRDIFHVGPNTVSAVGSGTAATTPTLAAVHQNPHQHQLQSLDPHAHHYVHMLDHQINMNGLQGATQDPTIGAIRVKHEAGLIINPNSLAQTLNSQNLPHHHQHHQLQHPVDTHIEMDGQEATQLMYSQATSGAASPGNNPSNGQLVYETLTNALANAPPPSYPLSMAQLDATQMDATTTCMLTSIGDLPHVQVVGTVTGSMPSTPQLNRSSAPSTPNHQSSSRKRKMNTQIDCADFACVKPDPGLMLSPSRSSVCATPLPGDVSKRSATSPLNIQLSSHDIADTPAHSTASLSPALSSVNMDGSNKSCDASGGGDALSPCIRFTPFQPQNWHELCDQNLQEIAVVYYRVDADKGFNFSVSDDAFVCQKKNHFQITCHARLQSEAKFVKTPSGLEKIKSFHLHFYGVKLEAPNQTIRIEQSQSDRSKKPFYPVPIDLQSHIVSKVTVGRLHFSETTNNNMRKKGRPNPEQRYFQLVVGLHVHTASGDFPIISQGSDKIIVRASNPGQFESDVDLCWQRGLTQDSIFHAGRVGINTDRPDESLVVHGNLKISGHIVQPSDSRAKQEINELDTSVQLRNLQKIRIVRYRLEPEFALHSGLKCHRDEEDIVDTGVIAQEVREVIPDAVQEAGSVVLPNGSVIENFLLVNKDRILMENIGAVKELCKVTGTLETRIENLERVNNRLQRAKDNELQFMHCKTMGGIGGHSSRDGYEICSNRTLQIIIFLLVIVMAACLAAVSTLYFVEHNKKHHNYKQLDSIQLLSNGHLYGHDGISLTEQEHDFILQRSIMKYNRTHTLWPSYTNQSSLGGLSRSQSQNANHPYRGEIAAAGEGEIVYEDMLLPPSSQQASSHNDEIRVVMEKPSVSHELLQPTYHEPHRTTTSPVSRTNKTIVSKHKHKWPQPQMVLRVMQAATHRNALPSSKSEDEGSANEDVQGNAHNASETSTEKISEVLLVQQDFENNSIDTDSQQTVNRHKSASASKKRPSASSSSSSSGDGSHSDIQKLHVDNKVASTARSINDDSLISPTQSNLLRHTNAKGGDLIIYKTVSPPTSTTTSSTVAAHTASNKVNTDAPHSNYSLETQPISNKSRNYVERNTDNSDNDLQSLTSNNNESIFNSGDPVDYDLGLENRQSLLGLRSAAAGVGNQRDLSNPNVWVQRPTMFVETFGEPEQCNNKVMRDDISNCQSVCFEENNQLLAPIQPSLNLKQSETNKVKSLQQEEFENEHQIESEDNDAIIHEPDDDLQASFDVVQPKPKENHNASLLTTLQGKSAHATQALAKELNVDDQQQQQQSESEGDAIFEHNFSDENLDVEPKLKTKDKTDDAIEQPILSVEPNRPPSNSDCWKIRSCILAERLNNTFSFNDFCPKLGKSVNVTYVIPLSRFFKEQSIELHLTSSLPLQWVVCNLHEHSKNNGKHLINSSQPGISAHHIIHQSQNVLQRRRNTSRLLLNIPSRGYFVKDLILRATNDPEKTNNLCHDKPHDTNTILQYNFRILRDCD